MKINKSAKRIMVSFLLLCLLLSGCANKVAVNDIVNNSDDGAIEIGMCFDSYVIERWEKDRDVFVSTARDLGAVVNVQNANGDCDEQIRQIEYFIEKGVDAIVIVSVDGTRLSDVVKKAKNKGIVVVAYDRMILNAGADLYISFDNEKVGVIMAEAIANTELANNKVLMIEGPTTDNNVSMIEKGFMEVMDIEGIEVVDSTHVDGWKAELAADYIYENPEILEEVDAIMCGNDNVATAVVRVLSEKRKAGKIIVVGQDAELEACQRIVEGTQEMTVYKPVEKEAEEAAKATVALIKGESLPNVTMASDGTYDIMQIVLEPVPVTKGNIDEIIIGSGFHLKEDVYLNVSK